MDIQKWFDTSGSYQDGLKLYDQLPTKSVMLQKAFKVENFSNFIKLKYELKRAINLGLSISINTEVPNENPIIPINPVNSDPVIQVDYNSLVAESERQSFSKETMAMYPMELHPVYRQRVSDFYLACELKFKLNRLAALEEKAALDLILQLEKLWDKIDKAWIILEHWKDHARIMPTTTSTDYTKFSPMQLANEKSLIETRISKRTKTIENLSKALEAAPEDRNKANQYNIKKEALEQLKIDLETIKNILKNG